jgi:hypothetical protein
MYLNIQKTNIIPFAHKTNSIHFDYNIGDIWIFHIDCVKYLGVMLDSQLYFYLHVNCISSQALKLLGFIHFITIFLPLLAIRFYMLL